MQTPLQAASCWDFISSDEAPSTLETCDRFECQQHSYDLKKEKNDSVKMDSIQSMCSSHCRSKRPGGALFFFFFMPSVSCEITLKKISDLTSHRDVALASSAIK